MRSKKIWKRVFIHLVGLMHYRTVASMETKLERGLASSEFSKQRAKFENNASWGLRLSRNSIAESNAR